MMGKQMKKSARTKPHAEEPLAKEGMRREDTAAGATLEVPRPPIQMSSKGPREIAAADVRDVAKRGAQGPGHDVPHRGDMEERLGMELDGVRAHTGKAAKEACDAMGAEAYAMGEDVVFAGSPDKDLVAHELAHVAQQRRGVDVPGGVGEPGDGYEEEAEAVSRGEKRPQASAPGVQSPAVQMSSISTTGGLGRSVTITTDPVPDLVYEKANYEAGYHFDPDRLNIAISGTRDNYREYLKRGDGATVKYWEGEDALPPKSSPAHGTTRIDTERLAKAPPRRSGDVYVHGVGYKGRKGEDYADEYFKVHHELEDVEDLGTRMFTDFANAIPFQMDGDASMEVAISESQSQTQGYSYTESNEQEVTSSDKLALNAGASVEGLAGANLSLSEESAKTVVDSITQSRSNAVTQESSESFNLQHSGEVNVLLVPQFEMATWKVRANLSDKDGVYQGVQEGHIHYFRRSGVTSIPARGKEDVKPNMDFLLDPNQRHDAQAYEKSMGRKHPGVLEGDEQRRAFSWSVVGREQAVRDYAEQEQFFVYGKHWGQPGKGEGVTTGGSSRSQTVSVTNGVAFEQAHAQAKSKGTGMEGEFELSILALKMGSKQEKADTRSAAESVTRAEGVDTTSTRTFSDNISLSVPADEGWAAYVTPLARVTKYQLDFEDGEQDYFSVIEYQPTRHVHVEKMTEDERYGGVEFPEVKSKEARW